MNSIVIRSHVFHFWRKLENALITVWFRVQVWIRGIRFVDDLYFTAAVTVISASVLLQWLQDRNSFRMQWRLCACGTNTASFNTGFYVKRHWAVYVWRNIVEVSCDHCCSGNETVPPVCIVELRATVISTKNCCTKMLLWRIVCLTVSIERA